MSRRTRKKAREEAKARQAIPVILPDTVVAVEPAEKPTSSTWVTRRERYGPTGRKK